MIKLIVERTSGLNKEAPFHEANVYQETSPNVHLCIGGVEYVTNGEGNSHGWRPTGTSWGEPFEHGLDNVAVAARHLLDIQIEYKNILPPITYYN